MANHAHATSSGRRAQTSAPSPSQAGGTPQAATDHLYGVVSVLYHALQGAQTYQTYCEDARRAEDGELEEFFEKCRAGEQERAEEAKLLLLDRLEDEVEDEEEASNGQAGDEDA